MKSPTSRMPATFTDPSDTRSIALGRERQGRDAERAQRAGGDRQDSTESCLSESGRVGGDIPREKEHVSFEGCEDGGRLQLHTLTVPTRVPTRVRTLLLPLLA